MASVIPTEAVANQHADAGAAHQPPQEGDDATVDEEGAEGDRPFHASEELDEPNPPPHGDRHERDQRLDEEGEERGEQRRERATVAPRYRKVVQNHVTSMG